MPDNYPSTFMRTEWFKLPMAFRYRWWRETYHGRLAPSSKLLAAARDEIAKQDIGGAAVTAQK